MKLIKPGYYILSEIEGFEILNIEIAGRTCYKSEDKITENSAAKFVEMIIKSGHESVLEHEKVTVKIICDRGVSHELVRHRIASYSQESTRFCNYSKNKFDKQLTFIIPVWIDCIEERKYQHTIDATPSIKIRADVYRWFEAMLFAENMYNELIGLGWVPQQARSVLPNSLKTEIVITANLREWRLIFKQRTAKAAHPQMREIMQPMLDEFKIKIPVVFDDINYE